VAENGEAPDAQSIGDLTSVNGSRCNRCAVMRSRASIARPVIADPTNTKGVRGVEKWLGRRTRVRSAVMPQDD
jgi:hypothetical protein